jgi:hypothetical protein
MEQWATTLANFAIVSRVVRDQTGLTGEFDLHFTALQEQLGLKLDSQKARLTCSSSTVRRNPQRIEW